MRLVQSANLLDVDVSQQHVPISANPELAWTTLHGLQTHPKAFDTPYRYVIASEHALCTEYDLHTCAAQADIGR